MLQPPTPKQAAVLEHWTATEYRYIVESDVAQWLNVTNQAAIALLSSMIRAGWVESSFDFGVAAWSLTDDAIAATGFSQS